MTPLDPVPAAMAPGTGRTASPARGPEAVADWCRALARWLLLGRRLNRDAPETRALREELAYRLAELVQARGEFTLDVTPRSLVLGDAPVFVAENANDAGPGRGLEHELSWVLHRDGIRRLHFRRGLTRESVRAFLDAIARAAPASATHEDVVTLLWDADAAGIGWEAEEVGFAGDDAGASLARIARERSRRTLDRRRPPRPGGELAR